MKLSRTSLRFPLGILAGISLLIGCQSASGPSTPPSTAMTAKGTVEFSDASRLPDFGVWRTNNVSRTTDTGRGSVVCAIKPTSKYDCSQSFALNNVLGSDQLLQDVYALGVQFGTLTYTQSGNQTQLTYVNAALKLESMESSLIHNFNTAFKLNSPGKVATPADLVAYYAALLLKGDSLAMSKGLPKGMSADSVKKALVQVASAQGMPAKVWPPKR